MLTTLSSLWLHEPDAAAIREAALLDLSPHDPAELAAAYADVFLLNVYPYGSVFTDPSGEMNGPDAQRVSRRYAAHGYQPLELLAVGAPDHLGLGLDFLAHAAARGLDGPYGEARAELLTWAPLTCLAVEREPGVHTFYHALAARTAETLLADAGCLVGYSPAWPVVELPDLTADDDLESAQDEVRLRDLVSFLLSPARCGLFLSRAQLGWLARQLGLALSFGSRFDVAELLFTAAGQAGQLERLLEALRAEAEAWAGAYRGWSAAYPAWEPVGAHWLGRMAGTLGLLWTMSDLAMAELS